MSLLQKREIRRRGIRITMSHKSWTPSPFQGETSDAKLETTIAMETGQPP